MNACMKLSYQSVQRLFNNSEVGFKLLQNRNTYTPYNFQFLIDFVYNLQDSADNKFLLMIVRLCAI